jgi:hypothetical protein
MIPATIQRVKTPALWNKAPKDRQRHKLAQSLRLSPTAWAKLLFFRDAGDSEVGGFGIAAANDLLYLEDVSLVRQNCDFASVILDDVAVADYFDRQVDAGRAPAEFGRVWVHTHPGTSAQPSATDEQTFARVFGGTQWAVMFILARGGATYARLEFHVGPGGSLVLPVEVDYGRDFAASDQDAWHSEYLANVQIQPRLMEVLRLETPESSPTHVASLNHHADRPDLWDELWHDKLIDSCAEFASGGLYDDDF